ncbi:hypothetical protein [uncultured Fibrobacter sp.]|uniref:hypothetical protein n=1 Tax=uncultured Fibrobacter sp. TaxID=261512 RepID=UPI0025E67204|nr:hypothetical protein [uncultured Fibrobacter sp.]
MLSLCCEFLQFSVQLYGRGEVRLAVPCEVCRPLVHQRSLRGLLELDRGRVDGFEVFVALVVDFAEAVVKGEALLGQCYFEFGVTPPRKFWFTMF